MDTSILQPPSNYPENWTHTVFDDFATLKRGKDLTRDQFREGSVPVAGSNGVIGFHDTANVKGPGITVGRSGSVGRVTFFIQDFWAHNTALFVTDLHGNDARFAAYFLDFLKLGRFGSGASVPTLDRNSFRLMPVIVPPVAEQSNIANVLSLVQRTIEQQERLIAQTTELKKALLHKLFTQGLRGEPQKQTEIGPVPQSWGIVRLEQVAEIERGKFSHRPRNDARFYGGQTPFVQTGDVSSCDGRIREFSQTLNEEGLLISKLFPAGTILITIAANIGFSGILEFDSACPDSLIGLTANQRIDVEFLQHYLTTQRIAMDRLAPRGTQKNINIQFLKPWPVRLPSKGEQREITESLNLVDSKSRVARRKHAAQGDLFRTLLHQLMTAQIRVRDLKFPEIGARLHRDVTDA